MRVVSRHNERLRDVARLIASSRERRKSGRCVLEGAHLVEAYIARIGPPETLIVVEDRVDDPQIARLIGRTPPARVMSISPKLFAEIATLPADVGALAVVATPRPAAPQPGGFCLLLDDVQDPGNVGSIIRTAAAAGVDQVLLSRACAFAWSPKVLRAGQGAHFLTTLVEDVDLAAWTAAFRREGGKTVATVVANAAPLFGTSMRGRIAVLVGGEGSGVSDALLAAADVRVTIPMAAGSESLNVAAATAIVLFEARRQRLQRS